MFTEMGKFNEELVKAGIMKDADGLKPSSAGKRIKFSDGHVAVIDGPFAETKELVAGFWIWEVKSLDEAVEWAKRCPNPMPGEEGVLEIRPCYSMEEFEGIAPQAIRARSTVAQGGRAPAEAEGEARGQGRRSGRRRPGRRRSWCVPGRRSSRIAF